MAKIKYLVIGIDNMVLSNLVGVLLQGESQHDLICCAGTPQAYKVADSGQVQAVPFETLLSELVRKERMRRLAGKTELKLLPKEG